MNDGHVSATGAGTAKSGALSARRSQCLRTFTLWPFALLVVLVAFGFWQSRSRTVAPIMPAILAAGFLVYSIASVVMAFGASLGVLAAWVAGVLTAVAAGRRVWGPRTAERVAGTRSIHLPGSWIPLVVILGIFAMRFTIGFVHGARLPVGGEPWFVPTSCLLLGALSGAFASRAHDSHAARAERRRA